MTEGIKPGIIACSHHLGRWRLSDSDNLNKGMSNLVELKENQEGHHRLKVKEQGGGGKVVIQIQREFGGKMLVFTKTLPMVFIQILIVVPIVGYSVQFL